MHDNDLSHLIRRLSSLQHKTLQPETGQHMEYASIVTLLSNDNAKTISTCKIWLVEAESLMVLHKASFSLQQRNKFN